MRPILHSRLLRNIVVVAATIAGILTGRTAITLSAHRVLSREQTLTGLVAAAICGDLMLLLWASSKRQTSEEALRATTAQKVVGIVGGLMFVCLGIAVLSTGLHHSDFVTSGLGISIVLCFGYVVARSVATLLGGDGEKMGRLPPK